MELSANDKIIQTLSNIHKIISLLHGLTIEEAEYQLKGALEFIKSETTVNFDEKAAKERIEQLQKKMEY